MSGFDEQIEAVREQLQASIDALSEPLDEIALAAIDALTKANEELRAEVDRLQTTIKAFNNGMPAMTTKEVADENADLRAHIDRLTKERDEAVAEADPELLTIAWMDGSHRSAKAARDEIKRLTTRLSAMQEAIDEAVRRADTETPFKTHVIVSDVVEPLRPFATKPEPEPEVDPLVWEVTVSILNKGESVVSLPELARLINGGARITALAARNHKEPRTDD